MHGTARLGVSTEKTLSCHHPPSLRPETLSAAGEREHRQVPRRILSTGAHGRDWRTILYWRVE